MAEELAFTISFDEDDAQLKKLIDAAVEKKFRDLKPDHATKEMVDKAVGDKFEEELDKITPKKTVEAPPGETTETGKRKSRRPTGIIEDVPEEVYDAEGQQVIPQGVTGETNSGLLSEYGYGHEPRRHYKQRKKEGRRLPDLYGAPVDLHKARYGTEDLTARVDEDAFRGPIFGTPDHVKLRGFQQSKVNWRGAIRHDGGYGAFPDKPGFRETFSDMQRKIEELTASISDTSGKLTGITSNITPFLAGGGGNVIGENVIELLKGIGPYGQAAVAAIGAIMIGPEVASQFIKLLAQKGGPLNMDWRSDISDQINGLLGTDESKRRLLGIDSFVVSQVHGYQPTDGAVVYNSLENRDEIIISKDIGAKEKAVGVVY